MGLGLCSGAFVAERSVGAQQSAGPVPEEANRQHRVECFELRALADGPALGFASLHRTDSSAGTLLEWQISFPAAELNLWHAESRDSAGQRWIFRERQPRRARSVIANQAGSALDVTEWGRPSVWKSALSVTESSAFPLELEERLRKGEVSAGNFTLFDPLANAVENVRLEVAEACLDGVAGLRRAELVRDDGTLAASWTFHDTQLASFSWQRGGLLAVRVDRDHFAPNAASDTTGTAASVVAPAGR